MFNPIQFIFSLAVVVNFLASLLFLMYPGLNAGQLVLVVCSAFFAGMIFFWLGVGFAFSVGNLGWIGFLPMIIFGGAFFGLHRVLERVIIEIPFGVILVGILSSVMAWIRLGDEGWARK